MLGNESSMLISMLGRKVPGNEGSKERKFPGTKVPESESYTYGTFVPRNESFCVRKFHDFSLVLLVCF